MLPLLLTGKVNPWRVVALGAGTGVIVLALYAKIQHDDLERTRAIYSNPERTTVKAKVRSEGPVTREEGPTRITEKTVKRPDGTVETFREEERGPVKEFRGPIFESILKEDVSRPILPDMRTDRWIVGAGVEPFHYGEAGAVSVRAGYGFRNRLDLTAGVNSRRRFQVDVELRF